MLLKSRYGGKRNDDGRAIKRANSVAKKNKPESVAEYKKKVWKLVSEYIRTRDADINGFCVCITCPARKHWREMHAGHFRHGNTKATYFFEKNIHAQCRSCNFYKDGARDIYAVALEKKYGYGVLQEIDDMDDPRFIWTKEKLKKVYDEYKEKLHNLAQRPKPEVAY